MAVIMLAVRWKRLDGQCFIAAYIQLRKPITETNYEYKIILYVNQIHI